MSYGNISRPGKVAGIPVALLILGLTSPQVSSRPQAADQQFVQSAASGGTAEVELGQLAEEHGSSEQVKAFGRRMVKDHSAANEKLQAVSSKEGMNLPEDMNQQDRETYEKLSKLSGSQFDHAYMANMVQDHKQDIAEFEKEAKYGKDPAVRQWAQQTLPTLKEHLQLAESTERAVSSSGM
jgi:putative membrane protein